MPSLIQVIYTSAASHDMTEDELAGLLCRARAFNASMNISGILLHTEGSFFQVLEGEVEVVDSLFERISQDDRHANLTLIIREPIAKRSFGDWTMGYSSIKSDELNNIIGDVDFFGLNDCFGNIDCGRAKKLLEAFKQGRWRTRLTGKNELLQPVKVDFFKPSDRPITFAYQPIIDANNKRIISYEALLRGANNESATVVLSKIKAEDIYRFDEDCRNQALELAVQLGLACDINLNLLPHSIEKSQTSLPSIVETAGRLGLRPEQIIVEIVESEIINDMARFVDNINAVRHTGLRIAIDDFGAGYAGLSLMAEFQPDFIKLDKHLVRDIDKKGPRQAIVRGIIRTCFDLGIDIIAEGIETPSEYWWLSDEGIVYFQGWLIARPGFEQLPPAFYPSR